MDFKREWTAFALEAEYDYRGMVEIAKEHNRLVKEALSEGRKQGMKEAVEIMKNTNRPTRDCCDMTEDIFVAAIEAAAKEVK